jgi:hypothetical protein
MADLDTELLNRLSRLAGAVPVSTTHLDPVHRTAVQVRHRIHMAWLTPAVALVIGAIVLGVFRVGPASQGSGVSSTVRNGDFELTLRSAKARYTTDEPIDVVGDLTYTGSAASVVISADSEGPVMFSVREPVFGGIQLGGPSDLMCGRSTLTRNTPLVVPFKKSGAFDGEHPQASQFLAYFADPVFRLPAGTWHIDASVESPCLGSEPAFKLQASIAVVVSDDPNATPGLPGSTPWADKPVYGGDDIGNMTLQVKSEHASYVVGSPVQLDVYYAFDEGPELATQPFVQEVAISLVQDDPNATVIRSSEADPGCTTRTITPVEQNHIPLADRNVVLIKAASWPATSANALARGVLDLPAGHWRFTAVVSALFGPCGKPETMWQVHASVEFDVVPPQ